MAFARRIGAKRIGIATCIGLIEETKVLVDILRLAGFETRTALCKVGSIDKTEIGVPEILDARIPMAELPPSPVERWGDWFPKASLLLVLAGTLLFTGAFWLRKLSKPIF